MALPQGVKEEDARRSVQAQKLPRWVIARTEPPAPPTPTVTAEWPAGRAVEHERPSAPMSLLAEHLRARRIVRPSVWVLGRMIGAAREASQGLIADRLAEQLPLSRRGEFDRLLEVAPELKVSEIVWLRAPAGRVGVKGALAQVAKYERLVEVQSGTSTSRRCRQADGGSSPPGRVASRTDATVNGVERHWSTLGLYRVTSNHILECWPLPLTLPLLTQSGLATTTPPTQQAGAW